MNTHLIAWGKVVSRGFVDKVLQICNDFDWTDDHASWLMACMAFESAETFSPTITNGAGSGAVGLIQFMPATARGLGTTSFQLRCMTPEEQLDWVKKYFVPYHKRIHSLSDMYLAILLPKYVGKSDDSVLFNKGTVAYRQNSLLDKNRDGKITKGEAAGKVLLKLQKGLETTRALQL